MYPQNMGLEKEAIEWIVLKNENNSCLCISKYLLDCKPYHEFLEKVIWGRYYYFIYRIVLFYN